MTQKGQHLYWFFDGTNKELLDIQQYLLLQCDWFIINDNNNFLTGVAKFTTRIRETRIRKNIKILNWQPINVIYNPAKEYFDRFALLPGINYYAGITLCWRSLTIIDCKDRKNHIIYSIKDNKVKNKDLVNFTNNLKQLYNCVYLTNIDSLNIKKLMQQNSDKKIFIFAKINWSEILIDFLINLTSGSVIESYEDFSRIDDNIPQIIIFAGLLTDYVIKNLGTNFIIKEINAW